MLRQAMRGAAAAGLLAACSAALAQDAPRDKVTVRGLADPLEGQLKVSPSGFSVYTGVKFDKAGKSINPDDVLAVAVGDLPGVDRNLIRSAATKEEKQDYEGARADYLELLKKSGLEERSKRYLEYKQLSLQHAAVSRLDEGWKEAADRLIADWTSFLLGHEGKAAWELWPATRACSRLQVERGRYDDAVRTWARLEKNANLPPGARFEAAVQAVDLQLRSRAAYSAAATAAGELLKTAAGADKDRLAVYQAAAQESANARPLDAVPKIKAIMDKSKDAAVHAAGFSMLGELHLAAGKPREAMWEFLMVETVLDRDRALVFRAILRLGGIFESLKDEEQSRKYRERIREFRASLGDW